MIFSSLEFVCVFLPVTYIIYCIIPSVKIKNGLLILASLLFYVYGEPVYVLLMLASSLLNYLCAYGISAYKRKGIHSVGTNDDADKKGSDSNNTKNASGRTGRWILVINVILNLGILGFFKYSIFLINSINTIFGTDLRTPDITLPVGISFFTFQALSYVIDVYRDRVEANRNYFQVLLYICFFPQLIAGPIVKYRDIELSIRERSVVPEQAADGLKRFIIGLSKKVLIANTCGLVADNIFGASSYEINALAAWLGAFSYFMQIYYDFSGYSDMAIGLGEMFGFHFKENFVYPYGAYSMKEFWRRWHISLSTWFKEYVYIPLGGNRKGKLRTVLNKWIVFLLTGLWHGANWTFVLWGLYHGAFLMLEEFIDGKEKTGENLSKVNIGSVIKGLLSHVYVVAAVCIGFVIFRADSVSQAGMMLGKMFGGFFVSAESTSLVWQQLTPFYIVMFIAAVIGCGGALPMLQKYLKGNRYEENKEGLTGYVLSVLLLVWCLVRLSGSTYNPFIYFRF
ncbi:MAG: MBOAT family protein [Lachnospiraceae bacterium]|nr:MBOAT family protein [Lachnospiraceae bacterium]